ncbi:mitochondrial intermediate peptidase-like [Biomphalaria glabrata]|uniref:Mitochondrial intermediate peptidase-like n=1 Tax=Biomphalaria glabrata TaxID=6526 RepID=A0A9W2YZY0_BIOGL|nr:mitochondrial intermediate peptidase-like [Biomphalaria glabrata]XP_013074974.2 mitochondrial intermediate peptidase-like [Biomphalaria glabrata]XP_055868342.1 mitochondrial intermediate peptidase-like [Biomphalaria glabrata]XP_055868343.1 mitochondrial intermediate peptidase-like [Biomphalaria glabrata]XP_055868345.1 mitochondrial intermediate peptidase-like [Biomphalaria glabrata]XP_055868346.1 mitochondrial intermediate peptidase-like [Biomphalaria glabrata]
MASRVIARTCQNCFCTRRQNELLTRNKVSVSTIKGQGIKSVSTWTPFAAAFNTKPQKKLHLKLNRENKGLFCLPQLKDHTGFYLLKQNVESHVSQLIDEATSKNRKLKMVVIFDELSDTLCRVADLADFVRLSHPDQHFAQAAEETCVALSSLVEKLNTNTDLYKALKTILEEGDTLPTDDVDRRVTELFMFDFEQSGIHLNEAQREQFVKLNERIHMLGTIFQRGAQKPVSIQKNVLPEHLQHVFGLDGDNIMVTGLFSDHYSSQVREAAYRIFLHPDPHQADVLKSLLAARNKLARLVGFETYSHRANRGTMIESPEKIVQFLNLLSEKLESRAKVDFNEMLTLKQAQEKDAKNIMPWDPPYLSAVGRQNEWGMSNMESLPYFSLGCVMEGLNQLFQCLFSVSLQHVEMELGEAWAEDIYKLAVVHKTEGVLGYIYCDFFERYGKPNQDCHFTIQGGRRKLDGTYQHSIVVLQLSLPGSRSSSVPTLLTPGNVDNLFHEFGHAMHSMLGRTRYQHVTGTRCSTDFAEVPSVLMEFFASEPKVISTFARHYKTGEPMNKNAVLNLCNSKKLFAASDMQQQVFFSVLDQIYHGPHPLKGSTTDILAEMQSKYYNIEYVPNTAWQLRFSHLVGYGARYYAYLVSRAVAAQLWHGCFKDDPFSSTMGFHYRNKMLAHGGEKHPRKIVEDMLGQSPTVENLVSALIHDMDENNKTLSH